MAIFYLLEILFNNLQVALLLFIFLAESSKITLPVHPNCSYLSSKLIFSHLLDIMLSI